MIQWHQGDAVHPAFSHLCPQQLAHLFTSHLPPRPRGCWLSSPPSPAPSFTDPFLVLLLLLSLLSATSIFTFSEAR